MGNRGGWIKLYRSLFDEPDWFAEPFTKGQAWVDLLLLANHRAGTIERRGVHIDVPRGAVSLGEEALAKRWRWSRNRVRRFLTKLFNGTQIERKMAQENQPLTSLIYIRNYEKYQGDGTGKDTGNDTENKKYKKKEENTLGSPPDEHNVLFTTFYEAYPLKRGKSQALKAWNRISPSNATSDSILESLEAQKARRASEEKAGRWVPEWPYPATWLNQLRWEDEVSLPEQSAPPDAKSYFQGGHP